MPTAKIKRQCQRCGGTGRPRVKESLYENTVGLCGACAGDGYVYDTVEIEESRSSRSSSSSSSGEGDGGCVVVVLAIIAIFFALRLAAILFPALLLGAPLVFIGMVVFKSPSAKDDTRVVVEMWAMLSWLFAIAIVVCFAYPSLFIQLDFLRVIAKEWSWSKDVVAIYPFLGGIFAIITVMVVVWYFAIIRPENKKHDKV